jgi:hypothetical protein
MKKYRLTIFRTYRTEVFIDAPNVPHAETEYDKLVDTDEMNQLELEQCDINDVWCEIDLIEGKEATNVGNG